MPPRRNTRTAKKIKPATEKGSFDGIDYEVDLTNKTVKAMVNGKEVYGEIEEIEGNPSPQEIVRQIKVAMLKPGHGYETKGPIYDIWYMEKGFGMVHITEYGDFDHYMKRAMGCLSLEGTKYRPIDVEVELHKLDLQRKKGRWYDWDIERTNGRDVIVLLDNELDFLDNMDLDDLQIE